MDRSHVIGFALRLLLVSAAAAAVPVRAAEEPAKKAVNDTITATKGDLEALKADHVMPLDPRLTLPGMGAPELSMPSSLPLPRPPTTATESAKTAKSGAWLIDAMEKKSAHSSDPRNRERADKSGAGLNSPAAAFGEEKDMTVQMDRRELVRDEAEAVAAVKDAPNPLTGFMEAWMTPHDFNLLKTTMETSPGPSPLNSPDRLGQALALPDASGFAATADLARRAGPAGPVENPYVQAMTLPSPQSLLPELKTPLPLPGPNPAGFLPPPVQEKPAPFRPEVQKRDDDAKYFPQLKRF